MVANSGKPNIEDYKQHVRLGSNSEVAWLGQHVLVRWRAQRFIEGMNQLLVPGLGLLQPRKEPRYECNEGRENRDRREAERIVRSECDRDGERQERFCEAALRKSCAIARRRRA